MRRIMVVCRDQGVSHVVEEATRNWMFETVACSSYGESLGLLDYQDFALGFCEEQCGDGTYRDLLPKARSRQAPVVVMISDGNQGTVFPEAMALGAFDVVTNPCSQRDVQWMVIRATRKESASRAR